MTARSRRRLQSAACEPRRSGQALVEFALVFPLLLLVLLAFGELAIGVAWQLGVIRSVDVVADAAAVRMATDPGNSWRAGWDRLVDEELDRADCRDGDSRLEFPDGDREAGHRVRVTWSCRYVPRVTSNVWGDGMVVNVVGESVIPFVPRREPETPEPSSTSSPSHG